MRLRSLLPWVGRSDAPGVAGGDSSTDPDAAADRDAVVVHDGSVYLGGAVRVVLEAARALDADLVVGFSGVEREWWRERAPNDVCVLSRRFRPSTVGDLRTAWRMLRLDLSGYGTVLTSGPAAKFYQPYGDQRVVHYLHHPPLSSLWFDGGLAAYALKTVDRIETRSLPRLVANSRLTARRARAVYGRDVDAVVNPPVAVGDFRAAGDPTGSDVVMVGRLEERKRPRVAVEAFRRLAAAGGEADEVDATGATDAPTLHLCGDGPLADAIARDAPPNVRVRGHVADDALRDLLADAAAGVFLARREDFGIVPIEYLASGTPVVAVDEPNTNEQVSDGETGVLVEPTPAGVAAGVRRALDREWDATALRAAADAYRAERFRSELRVVLDACRTASVVSLDGSHEAAGGREGARTGRGPDPAVDVGGAAGVDDEGGDVEGRHDDGDEDDEGGGPRDRSHSR